MRLFEIFLTEANQEQIRSLYSEKIKKSVREKDPIVYAEQESDIFDFVWNYFTRVMGSDRYNQLLFQWYCGTNRQPASMKRLEDVGRARDAIDLKNRFKAAIDRDPELKKYRDLNQITFVQLGELSQVLKQMKTRKEERAGEEKELLDSNQAQMIYNSSEWKVVIPKSETAAKYYGRNTQWCTAADNDNQFGYYSKKGDLIIFIHKSDNQKFQMHFKSDQYRNAQDEEITDEEHLLLQEIFPLIVDKIGGETIDPIAKIMFSPNPSEELQKLAVEKDGLAICCIANPSETIKRLAVRQNGEAIFHITDPSETVQRFAVQQSEKALYSIPNPSEELQELAVSSHGKAIYYIKNPSEIMQRLAVKQNGIAIYYIKNPSEEIQCLAVQQNGLAIRYIKNPSAEVQRLAIKQNPDSKRWINNPSGKTTHFKNKSR